jgi:hypothetical protein
MPLKYTASRLFGLHIKFFLLPYTLKLSALISGNFYTLHFSPLLSQCCITFLSARRCWPIAVDRDRQLHVKSEFYSQNCANRKGPCTLAREFACVFPQYARVFLEQVILLLCLHTACCESLAEKLLRVAFFENRTCSIFPRARREFGGHKSLKNLKIAIASSVSCTHPSITTFPVLSLLHFYTFSTTPVYNIPGIPENRHMTSL